MRQEASDTTPAEAAERSGGEETTATQAVRPFSIDALSPTAEKLLRAARQILETSGFDALTLQALREATGESKSQIHYHFGGKQKLVEAVVAWWLHENVEHIRAILSSLPPGRQRTSAVADELSARIESPERPFAMFYDLLPRLLADSGLREGLATLYADYREVLSQALVSELQAQEEEDRRALVSLSIAVYDGLALQHLCDPGSVDVTHVFRQWERLLGNLQESSTAVHDPSD